MKRQKSRFLGLDIGHHTIKAVEVEGYDRGAWHVTAVGIAPTPADSVADGVVALPHLLSEAIRNLMRHNNLQARRVVCSVSGPAVHFRPLRLPKMSDNLLRKAVMFKAREAPMATPLEEMIVEYNVQATDSSATDLDVLLVAAPRAIVDSRADVLSDCGLTVEAIDLDGFALMRALVDFSLNDEDHQQTIAIVSMGHTYTEFNIVTRGTFSFPRSIPIGGSHFDHTLQNSLGLDAAAVEEMKQMVDLRTLLSPDPYAPPNSPDQLLRPAMDELVREITRSINYYQSQFAEGSTDAAVDHVLLCGGGARMKGIRDYMSARLRMDVQLANPLAPYFSANESPELDLVRDHAPSMVSALGLALYGFSSN